jgi:hypothetical protein
LLLRGLKVMLLLLRGLKVMLLLLRGLKVMLLLVLHLLLLRGLKVMLLLLLLPITTRLQHTKCQPTRGACTVAFIHPFADAVLKCKFVRMIVRVPIPLHGKNCSTDVVANRFALICFEALDILDKLHPRFASIVYSKLSMPTVLGGVVLPHTHYSELTRFDHTYASVPSDIRGNCGEEIDTEAVHVHRKSCQFGSVMPAGKCFIEFEDLFPVHLCPRPLPPNIWRAFYDIYINIIANANAGV